MTATDLGTCDYVRRSLGAWLRFALARHQPDPSYVGRHCLHQPADHGRHAMWADGTLGDRLAVRDSLHNHTPHSHGAA